MAIVLRVVGSRRTIRPTDPAAEQNFRRAITETPAPQRRGSPQLSVDGPKTQAMVEFSAHQHG